MIKNALVVSGGGSKGAFAVGAIDYMIHDLGISFDIVAGTSTGSLIAPLVTAGGDENFDTLKHIYTSVETEDIIVMRDPPETIIRSSSVYRTDPLLRLIARHVTSDVLAEIEASGIQMFITTVCMQTARITYFQTGPQGVADDNSDLVQVNDRDGLIRAILASANQPVLMPIIRIPKGSDGLRQYGDGGVREYAPIKIAIDNGATDIFAIVLTPPPDRRATVQKRYTKLPGIAIRTLSLLTQEVGDNDVKLASLYTDAIRYLDGLRQKLVDDKGMTEAEVNALLRSVPAKNPFKNRKAVSLHIVRPLQDLGAGLEFDPEEMTRWMRSGRRRARDVLGPH